MNKQLRCNEQLSLKKAAITENLVLHYSNEKFMYFSHNFYHVPRIGDSLVEHKFLNCLLHKNNYDFMAKMLQICWNIYQRFQHIRIIHKHNLFHGHFYFKQNIRCRLPGDRSQIECIKDVCKTSKAFSARLMNVKFMPCVQSKIISKTS